MWFGYKRRMLGSPSLIFLSSLTSSNLLLSSLFSSSLCIPYVVRPPPPMEIRHLCQNDGDEDGDEACDVVWMKRLDGAGGVGMRGIGFVMSEAGRVRASRVVANRARGSSGDIVVYPFVVLSNT